MRPNPRHPLRRVQGDQRVAARGARWRGEAALRLPPASEKGAKLAQKLGKLQLFIAVFPQECVGQLASFGPT
jgi:hypothetical protein